jgi:predicted HTH domain antitoxin
MTYQMIIDYDDDVLANVALSPHEFAEEARLLLAAKLYEQCKLSSGQAAKLCGKARVDFLFSLPRIGIPMSNLRPDDAELEIDFAHHGYRTGPNSEPRILTRQPMSATVPGILEEGVSDAQPDL